MALLDFLIPPREQRIIGALVLRPGESYALNELIRIGGASRSQSAVIVDKLVAGGLALEERVGNQRRIRLNTSWPLLAELRGLCVKSFGVAEPIGDALAPLLPRIELAFVFGSVAKSKDHAGSDIDLMVVGSVSNLELQDALEPVNELLGRTVNFNVYSAREWKRLQGDPVIASILNGPRILLHERPATASRLAEPARARVPEGGGLRAGQRGRIRPASG
jgi:uncharacterized protein